VRLELLVQLARHPVERTGRRANFPRALLGQGWRRLAAQSLGQFG
jgi:hypothetical protein